MQQGASDFGAEASELRSCLFCHRALGAGPFRVPAPGRRCAIDPELGRLWEVCPECGRWNPVPLASRWEVLEALEAGVRERGRVLLKGEGLALFALDRGEVVRVGVPPFQLWGSWRYGEALARTGLRASRPGLLERLLGRLPPLPLEGYDPYGLGGALGGVAGKGGQTAWLTSPFLHRAHPLSVVLGTVPMAPHCPACKGPLLLHPWALHELELGQGAEGEAKTRLSCALCGAQVELPLALVRPTLRLALATLDQGPEARSVAEGAGIALDQAGGGEGLIEHLLAETPTLGELSLTDRVALGMALDAQAESEALAAHWAEAEEIAGRSEGDLSQLPEFQAFQMRVLGM
jgi:hypothetical protein